MPPDDVYMYPGYQQPEGSINRMFPAETMVGVLAGPPTNGMVQINGRPMRAAPGLQIRNVHNRIVLPTMMTERHVRVRYQLDGMGNAWRIWILTPAEIAQAGIPANAPNTRVPWRY